MFRTTNPIQPKTRFTPRWSEVAAFVAVCAIVVAGTVVLTNTALGASERPSDAVTPACATEDDTNCFWAAEQQGNGTGESFYTDAEGKTYYLPASDECSDNLKAWTRDASQMIEDMDSRWASSAPYSASVRTDNINPMTSRLEYIVSEVCD